MPRRKITKTQPKADAYRHPESESLMRPEIGTQAQFRKKKPPQTYRYDSSLSPAFDWDGQNSARERGEALIEEVIRRCSQINADSSKKEIQKICVHLRESADQLRALSKPFLDWAGNIANNEPPAEEVLVDRPEVTGGITRVCGPFVVEATIPTAIDVRSDPLQRVEEDKPPTAGHYEQDFGERMLEILRKSPVLRRAGNQAVKLKNIRPTAKTLVLSVEAMVANGDEKPVAFMFGPETGAVSERLVYDAAKEANLKQSTHLYVIGFAIQPNARPMIENCEAVAGIPATYVQATPDLLMGDLLKNMRSSQIFSVCGLPEIEVMVSRDAESSERSARTFQVKLVGLDVFDPVTMENRSLHGDDVLAWFLDTDYNGNCFHVCQAFFPRTSAWDNLKKALKGTYEEGVWDHLAGTTSAPFEAGEHKQVAVKVIDDRGNELLVVRQLPRNGKGK